MHASPAKTITLASQNHIRRLDIWEIALLRLIRLGAYLNALPCNLIIAQKCVTSCSSLRRLVWQIAILWYWLDVCYLFSVMKYVTLATLSEDEFVNFFVHTFSRLVAGVGLLLIATDTENLIKFNNVLLSQRWILQGKNKSPSSMFYF